MLLNKKKYRRLGIAVALWLGALGSVPFTVCAAPEESDVEQQVTQENGEGSDETEKSAANKSTPWWARGDDEDAAGTQRRRNKQR